MNVILRQLLSVACPVCGAAVGVVCTKGGANGPASLWQHLERWQARPAGKTNHLGYSKTHYYRLGVQPSTKCIHGTHDLCSGKLHVSHGMTLYCSCACHRKKT